METLPCAWCNEEHTTDCRACIAVHHEIHPVHCPNNQEGDPS